MCNCETFRTNLTPHERDFLNAYYKACNTGDPQDWLSASLAAKRMFNDTRPNGNQAQSSRAHYSEEEAIMKTANYVYGGIK